MLCPACQEAMHEIEIGGVIIDECSVCDGLWLDRDEPEQLSRLDINGKSLLQPMYFGDSRNGVPEGERICPCCKIKLSLYQHHKLSLDICDSCRGIFLDRWELQELFK